MVFRYVLQIVPSIWTSNTMALQMSSQVHSPAHIPLTLCGHTAKFGADGMIWLDIICYIENSLLLGQNTGAGTMVGK